MRAAPARNWWRGRFIGLSPRSGGPFVAINCAALPESLMESELFGHERDHSRARWSARGLFRTGPERNAAAREIGEMPIATQAKLLRVIEESKVRRLGGRMIFPSGAGAGGHQSAAGESHEKRQLREDLYYRLNVFHISLPPLRERKQDIPAIAAALIRDLNTKHDCRVTHFQRGRAGRFHASWPGNVRELRNMIERATSWPAKVKSSCSICQALSRPSRRPRPCHLRLPHRPRMS